MTPTPPKPTLLQTLLAPDTWEHRMWFGCEFSGWLRLMAHGRGRMHPKFWPTVFLGSFTAFGHTVLAHAQKAVWGREIAAVKFEKPPVFILGHWRSGTTLLHELLIQDPQHHFANTYQCMDPSHHLLTEKLFRSWFWFLMPKQRPMDNMRTGWERPQEDEFALAMLGLPSPYTDIAFPNEASLSPEAMELEGLPEWRLKQWKRGFYAYLQSLSVRDRRRLVLKSPPHTSRIPTLLELFPDAKFIHIMRNPYVVYPSTVRLWKSMYAKHGLQVPTNAGLEDKVIATYKRMYERLEATKSLIPADRFHETSYESLVEDPIGEMRTIYDRLDLGTFTTVEPAVQKYLDENADYEPNRHMLDDATRARLDDEWGAIIERYGYGSGEEPNILPFHRRHAQAA